MNNEFTGDPIFATDGYHLTAGSAAIDKGVDADITVDINGELRPADAGFDLGVDEYWPPGALKYIYLPLITR